MNSSKVIKQSFFHPSINKVFCTGKKHLAMMTETSSCILSQYLWYNANIYIDQTSIHFSRFPKKILTMFHNFLITMAPLNEFKREYDLHQNSYFL